MGRTPVLLVAVILLFAVALPSIPSPTPAPSRIGPTEGGGPIGTPASLSLPHGHFTENLGQMPDPDIMFYLSSGNALVGISAGSVIFNLSEQSDQATAVISPPDFGMRAMPEPSAETRSNIVRISFGGANLARPEGRDELPYPSNYFLGNDPSRWRTGVRSYGEVVFENLYEGIDLVYHMSAGGLKYDVLVSPGADLGQMEFIYDGVDGITLAPDGGLLIHTPVGDMQDATPIARQGESPVDCSFEIRTVASYGFSCRDWDKNRRLVIDPLIYSTYLGDTGVYIPWGVTSDAVGYAYITGMDRSNAYVAKLSPDATSTVFVTYFGGGNLDSADMAVVDGLGDIFVVGTTTSSDFPATFGSFMPTSGGMYDAFVVKLNAAGTILLWATYLGGSGSENGFDIALDLAGNVYACGYTMSPDFPVTPGAFQTVFVGGPNSDGFVAKLNPSGSALTYATFLGGNQQDDASSIVVDAAGDAYVTGDTYSSAFPTTPGALDRTLGGTVDAFVVELDPAGNAMLYGTFLGGSGRDVGGTLALDAYGYLYVAGRTESPDFPITPGAYDDTLAGVSDVFLLKLNMSSGNLEYSTYIGGSAGDDGGYVGIDATGYAFVGGSTNSTDFPVTSDAVSKTLGGAYDGFVVSLSPSGGRLLFGSYLGGSGFDDDRHLSVDAVGNVYIVGTTYSDDFPTTTGVFDRSFRSGDDAWAMRFGPPTVVNTPPVLTWTGELGYVSDGLDPETGMALTNFSYRVLYSDGDGDQPTRIDVRIEKPLGTPWGTFPMTLVRWTGPPNNYIAGAIFAYNTTLPAGTDWWYSFQASDGLDWATGAPTVPIDAPDVVIDDPPLAVARAFPTLAHMGESIKFDASNSSDDFGISAYLWDFRDGSTDTNPVVMHAYASRGTFQVNLTVWDTANQSDADTVSVAIENRPPTADAGRDHGGFKQAVVALNGSGSADPDGDPLSFSWTQTSGPASVTLAGAGTPTPTFTPPRVGTYAFHLLVNDGHGGVSEDNVTVTVWGLSPVARLVAIPPGGHVDMEIAFHGNGSTDPDGTIVDYAFDFGDGSTVNGTGSQVGHAYARAGSYDVTLTVTDDDGNTSTTRIGVTIDQPVEETNWKPLVALVFAIVLMVVGVWSSKRRPWKGGMDRRAVLRAFMITSMPFVLAEACTGIVSLLTGWLRVPPLLGVGMAVDLAILLAGIVVAVLRVRTRESGIEAAKTEQ